MTDFYRMKKTQHGLLRLLTRYALAVPRNGVTKVELLRGAQQRGNPDIFKPVEVYPKGIPCYMRFYVPD